jgi:hypothetical protein
MNRIILILLVSGLLLAGCSTSSNSSFINENYQPVESHLILELLCDSDSNCIQEQCPNLEKCPLIIALSHPVIFDFVAKYAACDGCNTPDFSPDKGIGKCVEYDVQTLAENYEVEFWVSVNCNFRYGYPEQTRINVLLNTEDETIQRLSPQVEFIDNPTYCGQNSDCRCLSGSGVELIGCSNFFHAPLHFAGYYVGEACGCVEGNCSRTNSESP